MTFWFSVLAVTALVAGMALTVWEAAGDRWPFSYVAYLVALVCIVSAVLSMTGGA